MKLRLKLLLSYFLFVLALGALGAWSAWRLRELGGVAQLIISENYDSVVAAQEMKESLERQDSAAVIRLLGQAERAAAQLREQRARFDAALAKAAANITEPGEAELLGKLRNERAVYYQSVDVWWQADGRAVPSEAASFRARYFAELEPAFHQLRGRCDELLQLNQGAMRIKSERAAGVARRSLWLTFALAVGLIGAGLVLAFYLARRIVQPIAALTATAARIAGGDLAARAEILSRDEAGVLAVEFNRMAARIRQLRQTDIGKLVVAQQTATAALDLLNDPVVVTDEQGRITSLNPAAEAVFGAEAHSLGKTVTETAPDQRLASAVVEALKSPASGETFGTALPRALNGSLGTLRPRAKPMRDGEGQLLGAVLLLENVSPRQGLDRFKSEFIATAAQALQEPLRSVQMDLHAALADEGSTLSDQQRDLLYACREDSEKLERIMRGLVELTKLEAGTRAPVLQSLNVTDLLNALAVTWQLQVEAADLTFQRDIPANLPPVQADPEMLRRVLGILLGNAIENTPRGGTLTLSAALNAQQLVISVADTGRGIPPEYLPRIFSRFVKTPGSAESGAGLELAIARRLLEIQGGHLGVQSQMDNGTVFSLTLPIRQAGNS